MNKINWSNYEQLAKNVWLYLTDDRVPENATINKEAFIHEVSAMIQSACMFAIEEARRVKKQRNSYEQELLFANRKLLNIKVELEELEKWCAEQFNHADSLDKKCDNTRYFGGKKDGFSLMKIKIQSLKQES